MVNHLKILIICIISFIFSTNIYVPWDFPTIQDAINSAEDYDYIFVIGDSFMECIFINEKSISIIGEESDGIYPEIQCSLQDSSVITVQNIIENSINISGFILSGFNVSNGINILNSEVELSNIEIKNVKPFGLYGLNSNIQIENLNIQNPGENTEVLLKFFNSNINFNSGILENFSSTELNSSILVALNSVINTSNLLIQNNHTFDDGTFKIFSSQFTGDNLNFINNRLDFGQGGAIYTFHSEIDIQNSFFENNSAPMGGAISAQSTKMRLTNLVFTGNSSNNGGAINQSSDSLFIQNCQFIENIAEHGGAINIYSAYVSLNKSLCLENFGNFSGGCILINSGELILSFSNILNNESLLRDNILSNNSNIYIFNSIFEKVDYLYYNFQLYDNSQVYIFNSAFDFSEVENDNEFLILGQNNIDIEDLATPLFLNDNSFIPHSESILIDNAQFNFEYNDSFYIQLDSLLYWGDAPDIGMVEYVPIELLGDINADGIKDIMDIILLSLIIYENDTNIVITYDFFQDGVLNIFDLLLLTQHIIING